jgi:hypothetical protein
MNWWNQVKRWQRFPTARDCSAKALKSVFSLKKHCDLISEHIVPHLSAQGPRVSLPGHPLAE